VLAAGDGRRLAGHTRDLRGEVAPKQYCSFGHGPRSMLQWAIDRAQRIVPNERVTTVVAREHERWWRSELRSLAPPNVFVQPRNKGTAAGVLLATIEILRRDPQASIVFLPSDHAVEDELVLQSALVTALEALEEKGNDIVLVGIGPDGPEPDLGWIIPGDGRGSALAVSRFVEKPDPETTAELYRNGAVWNSFLVVAKGRELLELLGHTVPSVVEPFLRDLVLFPRRGALDDLYASVETSDLSRDVLSRAADRLSLVVAPPCGWTDLGTPARLRAFLEKSRCAPPVLASTAYFASTRPGA
jgi:mannose-1-phosphate guanylyltransferase